MQYGGCEPGVRGGSRVVLLPERGSSERSESLCAVDEEKQGFALSDRGREAGETLGELRCSPGGEGCLLSGLMRLCFALLLHRHRLLPRAPLAW